MPGAYPRTSTFALNNVTIPYARMLADLGLEEAVRRDPMLIPGVNTYRGQITSAPVAESQGRQASDLLSLVG